MGIIREGKAQKESVYTKIFAANITALWHWKRKERMENKVHFCTSIIPFINLKGVIIMSVNEFKELLESRPVNQSGLDYYVVAFLHSEVIIKNICILWLLYFEFFLFVLQNHIIVQLFNIIRLLYLLIFSHFLIRSIFLIEGRFCYTTNLN